MAVGSLETDRTQIALYIGSLLANAVVSVLIHVVLRRTPSLWSPTDPPGRSALPSALSVAALLAAALVIALALPQVGYLALLVLVLGGPVERALDRAR